MNRAFSGFQVVIAAVIAVVFTIIAQLFLEAPDTKMVSLLALGTFLGGVLTPFVSFYLKQKKDTTASNPPSKRSRKGTDSRTLYVGNLPFKVTEEEVEGVFGRYGEVYEVRLVKDRRTGRKKGYGFVEMEVTGADLALAKLNDKDFEGRTLKVRTAHADQSEE
ncbi:RNA recognition motif domain-containing protein [Aliidiomarina indica]|uniref:RNA recognition motif domain-containing protein n=1 Tax=Aliidiomarina indica TaxID=2749147 RepID=UPI001E308D62|nr:RNA-binding protein [Aliidiomarina indica]